MSGFRERLPQPGDLRITSPDGTATSTRVEVMQDNGAWRALHGITVVDIHIEAGELVEVGMKGYPSAGLSLVGRHHTRVEVQPCPCGAFTEAPDGR